MNVIKTNVTSLYFTTFEWTNEVKFMEYGI